MQNEREPGPTWALADIGWIDFETRGRADIKEAGTYRYAVEADAIICAYAIGGETPQTVAVKDFSRPLAARDFPMDFMRHAVRVMDGKAIWAAWNAGFDKAIWNYATLDIEPMRPEHIIDVMAQAVASGLPPDLSTAARYCGGVALKDDIGEDLIRLFCVPGAKGTPQTHPNEWKAFCHYAIGDIAAMRSVFMHTRQLPMAEWREYWAMERINERGVPIDMNFVARAAALADVNSERTRTELSELTKNQIKTVDQVKVMTDWLLARLPDTGRAILTKREQEISEEGVITKPAKHALTRQRVERLIALCQAEGKSVEADEVLRVLQIRLYGGSKTPAKFNKMLMQQVDGVLFGQYVFNGAPQTGRASSKGVQIHNLARDTLPNELDLLDGIAVGRNYDWLNRAGPDPVARKLSLLIRPAFVPRSADHVFVWSDWSQIEARIVPWLADYMPGARERLQMFRAVDADPSLPDLYTRTAAILSHIPVEQVTKPIRQRGKVAELALGFCGGVGALHSMGAGYGMHFDDDEAKAIVDQWRTANPWVMEFSRQLWETIELAQHVPNEVVPLGRVKFIFLSNYLNGSLLCQLPSGRWLTYRRLKWEMVEEKDDDDVVIAVVRKLTFARGHNRIALWPGFIVENITQAVAADVLRGTLVRLESGFYDWAPVRLHTHDEIVVETDIAWAQVAANRLREEMQRGFEWSEGLPLVSEETLAYYYTKSEAGHGL